MEERSHLLLVLRRAVGIAQSHATEPDGRDLQVALSEFAFLHCVSPGPKIGLCWDTNGKDAVRTIEQVELLPGCENAGGVVEILASHSYKI
jgi:hypothetical protein